MSLTNSPTPLPRHFLLWNLMEFPSVLPKSVLALTAPWPFPWQASGQPCPPQQGRAEHCLAQTLGGQAVGLVDHQEGTVLTWWMDSRSCKASLMGTGGFYASQGFWLHPGLGFSLGLIANVLVEFYLVYYWLSFFLSFFLSF